MREMLDDPRYAHRSVEAHFFEVDEECLREFLYSTRSESTLAAICHCGHPKTSHATRCKVAGYHYGCEKFLLAAHASDPRPFYRATSGPGGLHAFQRGVNKCAEVGVNLEMAVITHCSRGAFHSRAIVVGLSKRNTPSFQKAAKTTWLCRDCSGLMSDYYQ